MESWKSQLSQIRNLVPKEQEVKLKFIDTHAHYYHSKFESSRNDLLIKLRDDVSHIINLGTDLRSNQETLKLISLYDYVWGMIGFFPTSTHQLEESISPSAKSNLSAFKKQLSNHKIVGIGEIGLDYFWDCIGPIGNEIKGESAREIQRKWFKYQIDLATEMNLPVSMHSRDAENDTIAIFDEYDSIKGVMHCFSYGMKSAKIYLDKGIYLGIGGTSTYPGSSELREVIRYAPLNRLLLETDAPYLIPQQLRKTRKLNTSQNLSYVIENIAQIKGVSEAEVIKQTNMNAYNLFGFENGVAKNKIK